MNNFKFSDIDKQKILEYRDLRLNGEQKAGASKLIQDLKRSLIKYIKEKTENQKIFRQELIKKDMLESFVSDSSIEDSINEFKRFTTFLTSGLLKNRSFIFNSEKEGSITYRIFDDNLPIFLDNIEIYLKYQEIIANFGIDELCKSVNINSLEDMFDIDKYEEYISEAGIDIYNTVLAGISHEKVSIKGTKTKGLNELINEYNQQQDKTKKIPLFKILKKQILGEKSTLSFIIESYVDDEDVYNSLKEYKDKFYPRYKELVNLFDDIDNYDKEKIYIKRNNINYFSNLCFKNYLTVFELLRKTYDIKNSENISKKSYAKNKEKYFKTKEFYSLSELIESDKENKIDSFLKEKISIINYNKILEKYENIIVDLNTNIKNGKKIVENKTLFSNIKSLLDELKESDFIFKIFVTDCSEKDKRFYNQFENFYYEFSLIDNIYNKCRNYFTKKPFSTDKIKLYFNNPILLGGWHKNREKAYKGIMLRKDGMYYLGIILDKKEYSLLTPTTENDDFYEKMVYEQLGKAYEQLPRITFAKSNLDEFNPTPKIIENYKKGVFKKGDNFDKKFLHELIDYYKKCLFSRQNREEFHSKFKDTSEYEEIDEFYRDAEKYTYKIDSEKYNSEDIDKLVEEGKLYLFQIYNKDFSKYSKGKKNLHTMYFQELFSEDNNEECVFELNGGGEIFYRQKSLEREITHEKNKEIKNKNPNNTKKTSLFEYDLIKDKRYTEDKFLLHFPITINPNAINNGKINDLVNNSIRKNDNYNIIGIDRGERNLLYVVVIDKTGHILYQKSLNMINNYDYNNALEKSAQQRAKARKDWTNISNIKELKAGYLSLAVKEIADLVLKYNAIIVMENLNLSFKNFRKKVEKSVYQKFEKALIEKFNYLVFKDKDKSNIGGIRKGLQLTYPVASYKDIGYQVGNIFYVNPWNTSKIDPTTGFTKLVSPNNNVTKNDCKNFIKSINDIKYNSREKYYEFYIDYARFPQANVVLDKPEMNTWTVCSYGNRLENYKDTKTGIWETKKIDVTYELNKLFEEKGIDITKDIKSQILENDSLDLYKNVLRLFSLTMNLRNSEKEEIGHNTKDQILSPVKNKNGEFFDSEKSKDNLPKDADANGAYNIALKGLILMNRIKNSKDNEKISNVIKNKEWLEYVINRNL